MRLADIKDTSPDELLDIIQDSGVNSDTTEHSQRVCKICKMIAEGLKDKGVKLNRKMLYKAAYLHDIGKTECSGDAHPFMSVVRLYTLFECDKHKKYARKLCSVIVSHKGYFTPYSSVVMEAAILRMADKIDKYNNTSFPKVKEAYRKSLKKIGKYFKKNSLDYYSEFAEVCKQTRKRVKHKVERTES